MTHTPQEDAFDQEGQTRRKNKEVRPTGERRPSSRMRTVLFLTVAAVFVLGPLLVYLIFGSLDAAISALIP